MFEQRVSGVSLRKEDESRRVAFSFFSLSAKGTFRIRHANFLILSLFPFRSVSFRLVAVPRQFHVQLVSKPFARETIGCEVDFSVGGTSR